MLMFNLKLSIFGRKKYMHLMLDNFCTTKITKYKFLHKNLKNLRITK